MSRLPLCLIRILACTAAVALFTVLPLPGQTVTNIFAFNTSNGSYPADTTPVQGRDGRIYGMANSGGTLGYGTIWAKSATAGTGQVLHNFDFTTGAFPQGGLTLGTDGYFYGVTPQGGSTSGGSANGVVFKISSVGSYSVLYNFTGASDGCRPEAPPIEASDGNLYGTASGCGNSGQGTVYKITRAGAFSTIHQFTGTEGATVFAPLTLGPDNNLWGTAYEGGKNGCGTFFKLTLSGTLTSQSLACNQASGPHSRLILAADGSLYGTAVGGGVGYGSIFKLTSTGIISSVYQFTGSPDFQSPTGGIMQATDGNFYGTALYGGANTQGGIYAVRASGYSHVYDFSSNPSISQVTSGLLQHSNGKLYGVSSTGGQNNVGSIFTLDLGLGPFVALVKNVGRTGSTVQILGQGLSGSTGVSFNGVSATTFTVVSDTYITAVVPSGATTGAVVVTTPSGTLTSNRDFRITP